MKICIACGNQYEDAIIFCPRDGKPLLSAPKREKSLTGTTISNKYRVIDKLGAGGMGSVYLAEQINLGGRRVALKLLLQRLSSDADALERFKNEAFTVGQLSHPNIVTIYEMEQTADGELYIAMEYLQGISLRKLLERDHHLPVVRTLSICKQVARALGEAHRKGIIHRDVKPDNIMVLEAEEGEDQIKVLDFGIAKLKEGASSKTQTGMVLGTPRYMSYEQASGMSSSQLDARSDIYSLGIVLFEMLTGSAPFDAETPMGTLLKHLQEEPPALSSVRPDLPVPAEVEALVLRCLAKDRDRRHANSRELAADLERLEIALRSQAQVRTIPVARPDAAKTTLVSEELLKMASQAAEKQPPAPVPEVPVLKPEPSVSAPPIPASRPRPQPSASPRAQIAARRSGTSPFVWVGLAAALLLAAFGGYWYFTAGSGTDAPVRKDEVAGQERTGGTAVPVAGAADAAKEPSAEGADSPRINWQLADSGKGADSSSNTRVVKQPESKPSPAPSQGAPERSAMTSGAPSGVDASGKAPGMQSDDTSPAAPTEISRQTTAPGSFQRSTPPSALSQTAAGATALVAGGSRVSGQAPTGGRQPSAQFPSFSEADAQKSHQNKAIPVEAPGSAPATVPSPAAGGAFPNLPAGLGTLKESRESKDPGEGTSAAGTSRAASEAGGGNPEALISAGQGHLQRRDYTRALEAFSAAERMQGDSMAALDGLAQAAEGAGRIPEAIRARKRLVDLQPNSGPAHSALAALHAVQGDAASATLEHRKAMQYANETWFLVHHGHDAGFSGFCAGRLIIRPGGAEFNSQDGAHNVKLPKGAFKDVEQLSNGFRVQTKSKNPISFRFASNKSQEMAVFFRILSEVVR
jgi:eukaryotic-like serine/threonine-protein kinase